MFFAFLKRKKSMLAGTLALVMLFTAGFAALGASAGAVSRSEIDALKQQQEQLAEQKAGIQAKADEISGEMESQNEKLDLLTQQLSITNQELEVLSEQIAIYTNTIAEMENELAEDKQKEQELLQKLKVRMRAMEENGKYTYISILFGSSSFQDLLSRIDCIRSIMEYDNDLVNDVRDAQAQVESAKTDMESEMADQQVVFADYQDKQADLLDQQKEAQAVLESLSSNSADYEEQLETVTTLQSSINGQISDMEAQLAEQERLKAEQEAAKKAAQEAADNASSSGGGDNGSWYGDSTSTGTGTGQDIVNYAESFLGVPYVYGGTSPSGFDCSGLVYYCYRHFGYYLNRTAAGLAYNGTSVSASALQPGDVILFTSTDGSYVGHTGIYIGGGQFIHAPHTGDVVKISSLSESYYASHFWGARRIIS